MDPLAHQFAEERGVPHQGASFSSTPKGAVRAASALSYNEFRMAMSLIFRTGDHALVMLGGDKFAVHEPPRKPRGSVASSRPAQPLSKIFTPKILPAAALLGVAPFAGAPPTF